MRFGRCLDVKYHHLILLLWYIFNTLYLIHNSPANQKLTFPLSKRVRFTMRKVCVCVCACASVCVCSTGCVNVCKICACLPVCTHGWAHKHSVDVRQQPASWLRVKRSAAGRACDWSRVVCACDLSVCLHVRWWLCLATAWTPMWLYSNQCTESCSKCTLAGEAFSTPGSPCQTLKIYTLHLERLSNLYLL